MRVWVPHQYKQTHAILALYSFVQNVNELPMLKRTVATLCMASSTARESFVTDVDSTREGKCRYSAVFKKS